MNASVFTKQLSSVIHDFDDDGCCVKCGFDGAEWHHWKHSTYEGKASNITMMPACDNQYVKDNTI